MGVRFPSRQERPELLQMQPLQNQEKTPASQEEKQASNRTTTLEARLHEIRTVTESQSKPREPSPADRTAAVAGTQTTGTMIDLLA